MGRFRMKSGSHYPIGTSIDVTGVNFSLLLCQHPIWHGYLCGVKAGRVYARALQRKVECCEGHFGYKVNFANV